jgi:nucleoid DNA-binding protein
MAKKTMPMKKAPKLSAAAKPRKKGELYTLIAEHTDLNRKQVASVFDTLGKVMTVDLAKPGEGKDKIFTVPGLMKVKSVFKPATKAREGKNPFTGEMQMFKAKPAKTVIKIRPLKALKDAV